MDSSESSDETSTAASTASSVEGAQPRKKYRKHGSSYSVGRRIGRKAKAGKKESSAASTSTETEMAESPQTIESYGQLEARCKSRKRRKGLSMPRKSHRQKGKKEGQKDLEAGQAGQDEALSLHDCEGSLVESPDRAEGNTEGLKVVRVEFSKDLPPTYDDSFYETLILDNVEFEFENPLNEGSPDFALFKQEQEESADLETPVEFPAGVDCHADFLSDVPGMPASPSFSGVCTESNDLTFDYTNVHATEYLKVSMLLLLSASDWMVEVAGNDTLRLSLHGPTENVAVVKAMVWKEGVLSIFVNNMPLPDDHFLWEAATMKDSNNLGEIADCLAKLAKILEFSNICGGVQKYEDLWKWREARCFGTIEGQFYSGTSCYRARDCHLIVNEDRVCKECRHEYMLFKTKKFRSTKLKGKDKLRINNRYLDREDILSKSITKQKKIRAKNRTINKLRNRVKKLIDKNSVNVSSDLSSDLSKIFQAHHGKMTEEQRVFWSEQVKALSRQNNPSSMRWNPFVIRLALHLQMLSRSAYSYLQNFLILPSQRTLYDYTHFVEAKEGAQEAIIREVKKDVEKSLTLEQEQYYILMYDEMTIRSDIVISKRTGDVVGYVHLNKVEEELAQLEAELSSGGNRNYLKKPAKKVLVFMLQGITNGVQEVVGIYATDNLTAPQLYSRCWDIIFRLERSGFNVLALICDGASMNRKFFNMHHCTDKETDFVYVTKNFSSGIGRDLFFIVDPPHLLKTLRNCFANSYAHRRTRKMWKNNQDLTWKVIELLHEVTLQHKYRNVKLTKSHVKLSSYGCMTVIYAAQVMSRSVVKALQQLKDDKRFDGKINDELLTFISLVNDFFDCLNGGDVEGERIKENDLLLPYSALNDPRLNFLKFEVLKFFDDWERDVQSRRGHYSKAARDRMFISKQSHEALKITIHGFIGAVKFLMKKGVGPIKARVFNQDKLEQYFGVIRMSGGGNTNPSVSELCLKSVSLHVQGKAAQPASKGNTQAKKGIRVDETPLQKKKRTQR